MTQGVPVHLDGVSRRFGAVAAVDHVSFELHPGEIVGLLGPNGAGKTTTMRLITAFLKPDTGRVVVGGVDVVADPVAARRMIGYLPESGAPTGELTVRAYLAFTARLWGMRRADRERSVAATLRRTGLAGVADQRIRTLSKGYRQRVLLGQALVHDPPVLVLDEPTSGLDPAQVTETRRLIAGLGRQRTVLLSSHLLSEVSALCRRVVIIDHGRVVADSPVAALTGAGEGHRLEVRIEGDATAAARMLAAVDGVASATAGAGPGVVLVWGRGEDLAPRVSAAVVNAGFGLIELRAERETLEDAYLRLVRR